MRSAADWARVLKTVGAVGCLGSLFAPLTQFLSPISPCAVLGDVDDAGDAFFALLIALAFLGPLGGAAHAWLVRGFTHLGSPLPAGRFALTAVALYGAGVALQLVLAVARRARADRDH
jgi:hypothetical protein